MTQNAALPPVATPWGVAGDSLYETGKGQRVELLPMGAYQSWIANRLKDLLTESVAGNHWGQVVVEMLFRLSPTGNLERRPDVAFVSDKRWPRHRPAPQTNAWDLVPDLAVEVISPSNTAEEVHTKIHEYFQSGVEQVWVVFP